jgi:hypothetical protein
MCLKVTNRPTPHRGGDCLGNVPRLAHPEEMLHRWPERGGMGASPPLVGKRSFLLICRFLVVYTVIAFTCTEDGATLENNLNAVQGLTDAF